MPNLPPHPLHAWQGRAQWRLLLTQWEQGSAFLAAWTAWLVDAQRSAMLHVTAVVNTPIDTAALAALAPPNTLPQARALSAALYGLLPGVHRLSFEDGKVTLTLWVGSLADMLRQQHSHADAISLLGPFDSDAHSAKTLARHCQRGTVLIAPHLAVDVQQALTQAGFVFAPTKATAAPHAVFAPHWEPRQRSAQLAPVAQAGTALVIGAGLAGAAIARSLALRGWHVTVLARGDTPADGASGLPAGLFCPHISPDDSVLSRLSRCGARMTLQRLRDVCHEGQDWAFTGVLERALEGDNALPAACASTEGADWSQPAPPDTLQAAGLPPDAAGYWHAQAGWVRPAQWVRAQLTHSRIDFVGGCTVAQVQAHADGGWNACDAQGHVLAHADIAIVAGGAGSAALLPQQAQWPLQPVRGQVTWGLHAPEASAALPPIPVNGNGNLVPHVPTPQGTLWVMGSTFERDIATLPPTHTEQTAAHAVNQGKLAALLPHTADALAPWFTPDDARCQATWAQVRCTSPDRLPIAGPVHPELPGLWALTALGARGLTLSVLCGELIAAQLHGEPLPLDAKLASHLGTPRLARYMPS